MPSLGRPAPLASESEPAREVAQISAVIRRDFSYPLLRAVAGMDDTPMQAALDRLAEADILLVQGLPPDAEYRFKHALIQDAAYENLLKSRRQLLHRRVGEALRDKVARTVAPEPGLLAHHFTQGGMSEPAIDYWRRAGDLAIARSANAEAVHHFSAALDLIATIGDWRNDDPKHHISAYLRNRLESAAVVKNPNKAALADV